MNIEEQLNRCGVSYFDVYLLHWLNHEHYEICQRYDEFGFLKKLKEKGKVRYIGFSYHDRAELLDQILTEHPYVDYVQLQINYLDWTSTAIEAEKCYQIAEKHQKKVLVMEPVKGGRLAQIPSEAQDIFQKLHPQESMASWAIRFAQSLEQVEVVLSGMNTMEQLSDNMRDMAPLNDAEKKAIGKVRKIINQTTAIPCTGCNYCTSHCPKQIQIPEYFSLYNEYHRSMDEQWKLQTSYEHFTEKKGKPSECIRCSQCEKNCPQRIPIISWLENVSKVFG